ncbi:hypothetical protein HN873_054837, partial [Arachis hypogaea]
MGFPLTKTEPLLLHVAVGSFIEATLLCSDECSRTSPAPASKHRLTKIIGFIKGFGHG